MFGIISDHLEEVKIPIVTMVQFIDILSVFECLGPVISVPMGASKQIYLF